jgi:hypothetical protein
MEEREGVLGILLLLKLDKGICVYKGTYPPTILSSFLFSSHNILYSFPIQTSPIQVLSPLTELCSPHSHYQRGIMSQHPLQNFGFSSVSLGSPPPAPRPATVPPGSPSPTATTPQPSGSQPAPRKHLQAAPPPDTVRTSAFGVSLAAEDRQLIHQVLSHFECMENAMVAAQAANTTRIHELEKQVANITTELQKVCQHLTTATHNKPHGKPADKATPATYPVAQPAPVHPDNLWDFTTTTGTPGPSTGATWPWREPAKQLSWADRLNAEVGQSDKEKPFTTIEHKKKKKTPETIIPKAFPRTEREVIITLETTIPNAATTADQALQAINKAINESADITQPPFILSRITSNNRLVLTTNPTTKAAAYAPYLQIIANAAKVLKPIESRINERWTKFLLHNVPTNANLATIRSEIESTYSSLCLGQDPCWLIPIEHRANKAASTLVVSLIGTIDYKCLGTTSLAICNRICRIDEYFSWNPASQCSNCQGYGYHPKLCKADQPKCAVCTQNHTTRSHPCTISTCRAGSACTHPPLQCANCNATHKANDPLCPVCIKHMEELQNKETLTPDDETMEQNL